jgi:predicted acetyltransferase
MALGFRWIIDEGELDRIAETRMRCYAAAPMDLERFTKGIRLDRRAKLGDYLLAERDGEALGTTTSLSLTMWVRGAPLPCQGVAFVGTIKTHRRGATASGQRGIASQLMDHTLRRARERGEVVSALMPFRASFYEHFGYGLVERRHEWAVPLSIFPGGDFDGFQFARHDDEDLDAMLRCRQRLVERGQCDIERSREAWEAYYKTPVGEFFEVVDRGPGGAVRGYVLFGNEKIDGRTYLRVEDQAYESPEALHRQFHFLASLKDQYSAAILTLPRDVPLNRMLRESQLPHRPVEHAVPRLQTITRMQLRVLDHKRFLEALKLPRDGVTNGAVNVAVHECEGTVSKFRVEIGDGRATVSSSNASPDIECPDKTWAAIACGDMTATNASRFGLIRARDERAARVLDVLSVGPVPFCAEYF